MRLKNRIKYWFSYKVPFTSGWNEYHNPLYVWWKCRKWFKLPYIHFYRGPIVWTFGMPSSIIIYNKYLDFRMMALGWKTKYDKYEYEWSPYIALTIYRKWQLLLTFNYEKAGDNDSWVRNMATWEAMMDVLWHNKSIYKAVKNHVWDGNITILRHLTSKGYKLYLTNDNSMCNK